MKIRIEPFTWVVYFATLGIVVCAYVAILRFGFGIHEKSSLLIDMMIFVSFRQACVNSHNRT